MLPIAQKYRHVAVLFYVRRLTAQLEEKLFIEVQPAKDWDERINRAKTAVIGLLSRGEKKIHEVGEKIDEDMEKKNLPGKISGYFKDKFNFKKRDSVLVPLSASLLAEA